MAATTRPTPSPSTTPTEPAEALTDSARTPSASPSPTASGPTVLEVACRADWDAQPATSGAPAHHVEGLMVHHAGVVANDGDDEAARLQGYQRYHLEQGWPDIAYHLGIGRSGRLYALRDPATAGDTFTDYDPAGWFLVLVDGHFDEQEPTTAQLASLAHAVAWAADRFELDTAAASHRDEAATSCPGQRLQDQLSDVVAAAAHLRADGGVALAAECGRDLADSWRA